MLLIIAKFFLFLFLNCQGSNDSESNYLDCNGIENGDAMGCFGCTDSSAINYDHSSTEDDNSCIWPFQQTQNQSFYFVKNILDNMGDQVSSKDFYIGAFLNGNCIGYRKWEGEYTDIPAMGNSGDISDYLNSGDIPSFKFYDAINNNQLLLDFDGICYSNVNHSDIINCGFINNGIYYINSLTLVY